MKELNQRQLQAIKTKSKITKAAMTLLKSQPYDNIKVSDICKLVGISIGGFYHYYDSKERLVVDAYNIIDKKIIDKYKKAIPENPVDAILHLTGCIAEITIDLGGKLVSNCYRQLLVDDTGYTTSPDRLVHKELSSLIEKAVSQNLFTTNYSKDKISMYINKLARGNIFDWCINKGSYDLVAEMQEEMKDLLIIFQK